MDEQRLLEMIAARTAYDAVPASLREEVRLSSDFRERAGLEQRTALTFNPGNVTFDVDELLGKVRALHGGRRRLTIADVDTRASWNLTLQDETTSLRISKGKTRFTYPLAFAFSPDANVRDAGLARLGDEMEFSTSELAEWRGRLRESALSDADASNLDDLLRVAPAHVESVALAVLRQPSISPEKLVPSERVYFERLVGSPAGSEDIHAYLREEARELVERWASGDRGGALRRALRFAAHPDVAKMLLTVFGRETRLPISQLPPDSLSRVGYLEFLAAAGAQDGELAELAAALRPAVSVESDDRSTLCALFIFVEGEIARTGVLDGAPAFWRRLASLAHAATILRLLPSGLRKDPGFRTHLLERSQTAFAITSLLDLRAEPRWLPIYAGEEHFRGELVGRIAAAIQKPSSDSEGEAASPVDQERTYYWGILRAEIGLLAFLTGPCEGGVEPQVEIDQESLDRIEAGLSSDPPSKTALQELCARGLVAKLPKSTVSLASEALRSVGRRAHDPTALQQLTGLLPALSGLAAATRDRALAEQVRILCRVSRRQDPPQISAQLEMEACLIASASIRDFPDYAAALGEWMREIMLGPLKPTAADHASQLIRFILYRQPRLWPALAPALGLAESVL